MSQPPSVVVELTTDVNSTVEHLQELGEIMIESEIDIYTQSCKCVA